MGFYEKKIFPLILPFAVRGYAEQRQQVARQASGKVLEIGMGTGENFQFYSRAVNEVVGLDFSREMLAKARRNFKRVIREERGTISVRFIQASATALGFKDKTFDTAIAFLVFCSLPHADIAAKEVYRVLKPGGRLLFFEHVLAPDAKLAKWQNRMNPLWKKVSCGCNLNRDTKSVFARAGFYFLEIKEFYQREAMRLGSPKIQGIAVKS